MGLVKNSNSNVQTLYGRRRGSVMKPDRVERAIRSSKASLAVEGLHVTQAEEDLVRLSLSGQISDREFHERLMELVNGHK